MVASAGLGGGGGGEGTHILVSGAGKGTSYRCSRCCVLSFLGRLDDGLDEVVRELLVGRLLVPGDGPEVRSQETVSVLKSFDGSLDGVPQGGGMTTGTSVAVTKTRHLQDLLGRTGRNNTSTTRSRDKTNHNGPTLARDLHRYGMGLPDVGAPVPATDRNDVHLGQVDRPTNGGGDFLGCLDTETKVTIGVPDDDKGLETGTLTRSGLLLDGHDLHHLVLELGPAESLHDLVLLDRNRVEVDLLERVDLALQERNTHTHTHTHTRKKRAAGEGEEEGDEVSIFLYIPIKE